MKKSFVVFICFLFSTVSASAAERSFHVSTSRKITTLVERFYGKDNNAFATLYCQSDSPQVMYVDSRLPDLDGKTFYFASLAKCEDARSQARKLSKKCNVQLVIDQRTLAARVVTTSCGSSNH